MQVFKVFNDMEPQKFINQHSPWLKEAMESFVSNNGRLNSTLKELGISSKEKRVIVSKSIKRCVDHVIENPYSFTSHQQFDESFGEWINSLFSYSIVNNNETEIEGEEIVAILDMWVCGLSINAAIRSSYGKLNMHSLGVVRKLVKQTSARCVDAILSSM